MDFFHSIFGKTGPPLFSWFRGKLVYRILTRGFRDHGNWAENNVVALSVPLLILILPIFDTSMTTFFRIREGKVRTFRQWLDYAGKDHLHHRIYATGIGKRNAVFVLWFITLIIGLSAVIIRTGGPLEAYLALIQAGAIMVFFLSSIIYTKAKQDTVTRISEQMTWQGQDCSAKDGNRTVAGE